VDRAIELVREQPFVEGAKLIAAFTLEKRDIATSIEFLVLSKDFAKAFDFATSYDQMDAYQDLLDRDVHGHREQYREMAEWHLRTNNDHASAAQSFLKADMLDEALMNWLEAGAEEHLDDIVSVIRECNDDENIVNLVLDHIDAAAENSNAQERALSKPTLFRLYLAVGDIALATKMAMAISAQSQRMGQYQSAHTILFEMVTELMARGLRDEACSAALLLLHSYLLVKVSLKKRDDYLAATMLIRVSESISKFPSHTVQLLTSTVVQCQKTGFFAHAIEYANHLMRAELRKQIIPKYKKRIEKIVRHSYKEGKDGKKGEEAREKKDKCEMSACPRCKAQMASTSLYCKACKNQIPYCIITGKHMVADDWTYCPHCAFPALFTYFVDHIEKGFDCPMCHRQVEAQQIELHQEPVF